MSKLDVEGAKKWLKELWDESGDSPWLEGWICGYTDGDHNYENTDEAHDELFNYLESLRSSDGR